MKTSSPEVFTTSQPLLCGIVRQYEWYDFSQKIYQNLPGVFPNSDSGLHFYFASGQDAPAIWRPFHVERFQIRQEAVAPKTSTHPPLSRFRLFRVLFYPEALKDVFSAPNETFGDRATTHRGCCPEDWETLLGEMDPDLGPANGVALLESYLLKKVKDGTIRIEPVIKATRMATLPSTDVRVQELASTFGISRRHLNRRFHEVLGISIKQYLRVLRFQKLLNCLISTRERHPAEDNHKLGFYDQAHLCNEFKRLARLSPKQFIKVSNDLIVNPQPGKFFQSILLKDEPEIKKEYKGFVPFLQE